MRNNIIKAIYSPNRRGFSVCPAAYQWDYGLVLQVEGLTLPDVTEWHFGVGREAVKAIGNATSVAIPDECLKQTGTVPVYFFGHTGESDGETAYKLSLPVIERPKPSDVTPTPAQQDALDKAIAVLQAASDPFAYSDDGDGNIVIGEGATGGTTKALQSIQFPGLTDTYTVEGGSVDVSAILPTANASGAVAVFPDGYSMSAKDVKVTIEPKQSGSGDPSPENVREITGWDSVKVTRAGKNLVNFINSRSYRGIEITYDATTGSVAVSGTATGDVYSDVSILDADISKYIRLKAGTYTQTITASDPGTDARLHVQALYDDGTTMAATVAAPGVVKSFTLEHDAWICPRIQILKDKTISGNVYPIIVAGSSISDFVPYQGQDYTIPLGQTVYGGTLDVTTGELVVDKTIVNLSAITGWTFVGTNANGISNYDSLTLSNLFGADTDAISNVLPYQNIPSYVNVTKEGFYTSSGKHIYFRVDSSRIGSLNAFKAWLTETAAVVVTKLETPQTYTLTPQEITLLLGDNTVFADAGPVEVTYGADIQRYIDKKIAETQALILEN